WDRHWLEVPHVLPTRREATEQTRSSKAIAIQRKPASAGQQHHHRNNRNGGKENENKPPRRFSVRYHQISAEGQHTAGQQDEEPLFARGIQRHRAGKPRQDRIDPTFGGLHHAPPGSSMMTRVIEKIGAGEGNRTLVISLEGCCST